MVFASKMLNYFLPVKAVVPGNVLELYVLPVHLVAIEEVPEALHGGDASDAADRVVLDVHKALALVVIQDLRRRKAGILLAVIVVRIYNPFKCTFFMFGCT